MSLTFAVASERPSTRGTLQPSGPRALKVACTAWSPVIVSTHVVVPEQSPDQPVKRARYPSTAFSMTEAPVGKALVHSAPQSIPGGVLTTVPAPVPAFVTVSVNPGGGTAPAVPSVAAAASAASAKTTSTHS